MSLKLGSNIITLTYLDFSGYLYPNIKLSEWNQIAATFSYYKFKASQNIHLDCFAHINANYHNIVLQPWDDLKNAIPPTFDQATDQVFIGGGGENSFIGVIGKFDIFNPGALIESNKWMCHLEVGYNSEDHPSNCIYKSCNYDDYYEGEDCIRNIFVRKFHNDYRMSN